MLIFTGNEATAYRDPACYFYDGCYYLFFTVSKKQNGYMYNHIALSTSEDLFHWTEPRLLTQTDNLKNYCSPGCIIEKDGEFILCFSSYPMPKPFSECSMADDTARLYLMRTKDFMHFSVPEKIYAKGKGCDSAAEGRMIDPFLIRKDNKYLLYFKQNGISLSVSVDLENWVFQGATPGGENTCVIEADGKYLLIHSPQNGIGIKESTDLKNWEDKGVNTLEQVHWDWASGRLTAGFAMKSNGGTKYKYILFFHGSKKESVPETHGEATLACAFTNDFQTFSYEP